jgi:hypothetical protein
MPHTWIVDGIEENVARVEIDGDAYSVPRWLLPDAVGEGDAVRVELTREAARTVLTVERDDEATRAALARSAEQVRERGAAKDAGGDIVL